MIFYILFQLTIYFIIFWEKISSIEHTEFVLLQIFILSNIIKIDFIKESIRFLEVKSTENAEKNGYFV